VFADGVDVGADGYETDDGTACRLRRSSCTQLLCLSRGWTLVPDDMLVEHYWRIDVWSLNKCSCRYEIQLRNIKFQIFSHNRVVGNWGLFLPCSGPIPRPGKEGASSRPKPYHITSAHTIKIFPLESRVGTHGPTFASLCPMTMNGAVTPFIHHLHKGSQWIFGAPQCKTRQIEVFRGSTFIAPEHTKIKWASRDHTQTNGHRYDLFIGSI
jgi:hypothetical protein